MVKVRKASMFVVIVLSILMMLGSITAFAAVVDIPDATSQFYVNDFANVIDDETEREMVERAKAYSDATSGVQVVVTTVQTIGNANPVKYTTDMYNKYGIGMNNMGVLIMLSVETRDIQMREGDNIRKYISASKCGDILDEYGIPYLAENNFEEGLYQIQKATIEYLEGKSLLAEEEVVVSTPSIANTEKKEEATRTKTIIKNVLLVLAIVACLVGAGYGIKVYSKARKEKKVAEEIERIENSEIVKSKNERIEELETMLTTQKMSYEDKLCSRNSEIANLDKDLIATKRELSNIKERYKRAVQAYPDVDEKVDAIFAKEKEEADKAAAREVENHIKYTLGCDVTRMNLNRFHTALDKYKALTSQQRKYVSSELVSKVENAYRESSKLQREYEEAERIRKNKEKAAEVQKLILAAIAISATRHSLRQIKNALDAYNYLNSDQKKYITADINALNNALRRAKRDQEEYEEEEERRRRAEEERRRRQREEEEERRRRASSYSSSSFGGSSFGGSSGFGGHSSGHGAGRKF